MTPQRFRKKLHGPQPEVEAMLVTDRNGAEVEAWCGGESYDVAMAPGQTHHIDITRPNGSKTCAYVGDYVVRDGDRLYPQSRNGFEFNYEPASAPQPQAEDRISSEKADALAKHGPVQPGCRCGYYQLDHPKQGPNCGPVDTQAEGGEQG